MTLSDTIDCNIGGVLHHVISGVVVHRDAGAKEDTNDANMMARLQRSIDLIVRDYDEWIGSWW